MNIYLLFKLAINSSYKTRTYPYIPYK